MKKVINCSKCNQKLNVPVNIGGMLMECPACGHRFHSDFKLAPSSGDTAAADNHGREPEKKTAANRFSVIV